MSRTGKNNILILFAHPGIQNSRVNRVLCEAVRDLDGITFHDLYEAYPEFDIDVSREQELAAAHDIIIFQHPFFWYSTPAILKEWQDLVLQHGWAYGTGGTALHDKIFMSAVTTGADEGAYQVDGFTSYTIRQLLAPIERTAILCGMKPLSPFIAHGTLRMEPEEMEEHARDYARLLTALHRGKVDLNAAAKPPRINGILDKIIKAGAKRG